MKVDTSNWRTFRIDDVFVLKGGFYNKKPEHSADGDIPFLAASENNNAATEFYNLIDIAAWDKVGDPDDKLTGKIFTAPAIAVTVNGACCNAFYQPCDYTCSHDITSLYPKDGHNLTVEEGLFICTIIKQEQYRWSYGRKPHDVNKLAAMTIKLPSTSTGEPNWKYMKEYVEGLHSKPLTTSNKSSGIALDTSDWKKFRIGDLFDVELSKGDIKLNDMESGNIPLVSSGETHNGLIGHINPDGDGKAEIFPSNVITLDMFGNVYYQNKSFYAVSHGRVNVLKPKKCLNQYIGLFLSTVIKQEQYKYSYGRAVYSVVASNMTIRLPSTNGDEPDWEFMENYIKSLPYGDRIAG